MSASIIVAFITGVLGPVLLLFIKNRLDKKAEKPDMVLETLKVSELVMTKLDHIKELSSIIMSYNKSEFIRKNFWYLIESVVKLGVRKNINTVDMKEKIMEEDIDKKLKHMSISKIVNYLCLHD